MFRAPNFGGSLRIKYPVRHDAQILPPVPGRHGHCSNQQYQNQVAASMPGSSMAFFDGTEAYALLLAALPFAELSWATGPLDTMALMSRGWLLSSL